MTISQTKQDFKTAKLSKQEFNTQMFQYHQALYDVADNLNQTEIDHIEIQAGKVIFTAQKNALFNGGVKFLVDPLDKHTPPVIAYNFNTYEKEDADMLYLLVFDSEVIFDIGANIGWYTNHLAKKQPNAKIYAFEPIADAFRQLKVNTQLNNLTNVSLHNLALSNQKGLLSFYYSPLISGASSSVNITENDTMQLLDCSANTLDSFVEEYQLKQIDFIKCDVEGAEYRVYQGGINSLEKFKPIVFSEMLRKWSAKFNYHPNDIIALFKELGYQCFVAQAGKLNQIDCVTEQTLETNYFFLHSAKHSAKIKQFAQTC